MSRVCCIYFTYIFWRIHDRPFILFLCTFIHLFSFISCFFTHHHAFWYVVVEYLGDYKWRVLRLFASSQYVLIHHPATIRRHVYPAISTTCTHMCVVLTEVPAAHHLYEALSGVCFFFSVHRFFCAISLSLALHDSLKLLVCAVFSLVWHHLVIYTSLSLPAIAPLQCSSELCLDTCFLHIRGSMATLYTMKHLVFRCQYRNPCWCQIGSVLSDTMSQP